jgi:hypothetical protein
MTDDIVTRLRRWVHAVDAVPASDLMDEAAAEIERLRRDSKPHWRDRSESPPLEKPVLFFTNHLDGFMWIGRRGLLPNDVSHWMPLPEPPGESDGN